eukprot:9432098-Pyramimonas_sp.AAC.1
MVRQEVQLKKLNKLINGKFPTLETRVHRAGGFLSVDGAPIVQVTAGAAPDAATQVRWSDAAAPAGTPITEHAPLATALAAAFANPLAAVRWL